jgi:hypothetical protein
MPVRRMRDRGGTFVKAAAAIVIALIIIIGVVAYYQAALAEAESGFVTGTSVDTQFTASGCVDTGGGALQLRLISDYFGFPIHGELINAQYMTPNCGPGSAPPQPVYIANFTAKTGGWLTPVYPSGTPSPGELNFSVAYGGTTYTFNESVPAVGAACVTLHIPSGGLTTLTTTSSTCN